MGEDEWGFNEWNKVDGGKSDKSKYDNQKNKHGFIRVFYASFFIEVGHCIVK